jgi:hypothetical protein
MEKGRKQTNTGVVTSGNRLVRKIEGQRDVIEDCVAYLSGIKSSVLGDDFLVIEKQYPVDSSVVSRFMEE